MESFGADDAQFPDVFEDSSEDESPAEASKRAADFTRASLDVTMSDDPVVLQHRLGKLQLALRSCQIQQELQQAQVLSGAQRGLQDPRTHPCSRLCEDPIDSLGQCETATPRVSTQL
eukprot:scaffold613_cov243-Pinguiococcus_pyrenoidosus.AAC.12